MKKSVAFLTITSLSTMVCANLSCMKLLNKISEDDACTKAFVQRCKLSDTHDPFEKSQLLQEIEVLDRLCQERNAQSLPNQKVR
jgi:hypothetical protein